MQSLPPILCEGLQQEVALPLLQLSPSKCLVTTHLSAAGQQDHNCSLHAADAVAVDKLLRALTTQPQLEVVVVALAPALRHHWEDNATSGSDTEFDDLDKMHLAQEAEQYRQDLDITAQMFHPAWASVCRLLEDGHMSRLRYTMA